MSEKLGMLLITCAGILAMTRTFIFFVKTMKNTLNYHNQKIKDKIK